MINSVENEILKVISASDYEKGINYDEDYVNYVSVTQVEKRKRYQFLVESERYYSKYGVQIDMQDNHIVKTFCTCPQYYSTKSCKHIAASLVSYSDKLFHVYFQLLFAFNSTTLPTLFSPAFNCTCILVGRFPS